MQSATAEAYVYSPECLLDLVEPLAAQSEKSLLLLIDDNEDVMFFVRHVLDQHGCSHHRLAWAKTLCDGLHQLSKGNVDLVLLDLGLPESSGLRSFSRVRNCAKTVPIVVLTADDSPETRDHLRASGVDELLIKQNISGQVLLDTIDLVLRRRSAADQFHQNATLSEPARILLIEDDEDAMLLVRFALQEYGRGQYQLEWAQSLTDGLALLAEGGVAVVLLDVGLPDSAGAAGYMQVLKVAPEIPVIVLTGSTCLELEFILLASGAKDYLEKPFVSGLLLLDAIRAALFENKRQRHERRHMANAIWGM